MNDRYRDWDLGEYWCTGCAAVVCAGATSLHDAFHDRIDRLAAVLFTSGPQVVSARRPVARRTMNVEHLAAVALVYREAVANGDVIDRAIMRAFPGRGGRLPAKSTVFRWVAEARRLGLLSGYPEVGGAAS